MMAVVWVCRCGTEGEFESFFLDNGEIGFSLIEYKNYSPCDNLKSMSRQVKNLSIGNRKRSTILARTFAITNRMCIGDYVLCPSKMDHSIIHAGLITGNCIYNLDATLTFCRSVEWLGIIERDSIDRDTLHSMGSLQTIFKINADEPLIHILAKLRAEHYNCT